MKPLDILLLVGAAQGGMLALFLLTNRRGNRVANRLLAILIGLFSVSIALHTIREMNQSDLMESHAHVIHALIFLFGPLLYFYVVRLTEPGFRFRVSHLLHLLPFVFSASMIAYLYLHSVATQQSPVLCKMPDGVMAGFVLQTILYVGFCFHRLQQHAHRIQETFSTLDLINLRWLRILIIMYCLLWILIMTMELVWSDIEWNITWLMVSVCLYLIGYMGLRQPEIFAGSLEPVSEPDKPSVKYQKSTLTQEMAENHKLRLEQFMLQEKPYLDSRLSQPILADKLGISSHHLSQLINENYNRNFFQFINYYRVEEAKRQLKDPENDPLTISAICFNVGFVSLSSFNTAFKKFTGQTPSQFRESSIPE